MPKKNAAKSSKKERAQEFTDKQKRAHVKKVTALLEKQRSLFSKQTALQQKQLTLDGKINTVETQLLNVYDAAATPPAHRVELTRMPKPTRKKVHTVLFK